eukprot:CAMPEP_0171694660 /NCGR_PEP_ID=MMETSP0991-20121206/7345_1 /TAXON_ID=483369 /ORGANISM="non described non described, Strain CCMP2098" /LENGTH=77 /DNA_ID=CAMNT_0012283279 /DNA_START=368 /DNA_END=598 /DNA_ORIENTATION=+
MASNSPAASRGHSNTSKEASNSSPPALVALLAPPSLVDFLIEVDAKEASPSTGTVSFFPASPPSRSPSVVATAAAAA